MKPVVVVVHGEADVRQDLVGVLTKAGLTAQACAAAEEALDYLAEQPSVQLFVLDIQLPGMDGWKLCRLLRLPALAAYNHTPILMTSAQFCGVDTEAISLDVGANAFLPRPFSADKFLSTIKALLSNLKPQQPQRVLIIEDDPELSRMLQLVFARQGYLTACASTCAEALVRFEQQLPDSIVMDYHLLDADSQQLLPAFRASDRVTAIVAMTGDTDPQLPLNLMRGGVDSVLRKPFKPEEVVAAAQRVQRQRAALHMEKILAPRNRQLQLMEFAVEHSAEPVFWCNPEGRLLYANAALLHALGYARADLANLNICDLDAHLAKADWPEQWRQWREQGVRRFETEFRTQDGRLFPAEIVANYLCHENCEYGCVGLHDLTERRRLQDQYSQNERLESIGRLAGGVAHDFNNILQSILGFSELLVTSLPPNDARQRDLNEIQKAAQRAARLTSELLAYSQKQMIDPRVADINHVITDMQEPLRAQVGPGINLHLDLQADPARVTVDAAQIERVLKTMTRNAAEAMPNGGRFTISTENIVLQPSDIGLIAEGRHGHFIRIALSDTGCGIPRDVLPYIFEPFYSTKGLGQGTGLGLAMAYGIIKQHQGWINVYSEPNHGTTFKIYLPLHATAAPANATAAPPLPLKVSNKKILLVEDEPSVNEYAERVLSRRGYEVHCVAGVREALQRAEQEGEGYALLFSDIVLLDGNGIELADQLRARQPGLRVLLTSGYTDDQARWPDIAQKNYRFMPKPYPAATLLKTMDELLAEKKG